MSVLLFLLATPVWCGVSLALAYALGTLLHKLGRDDH